MTMPTAGLLWTVWIGSAAVWLGLSVIVYRRWKLPQKSAPWVILIVAAAVRLGYVGLMPPVLSDDIWRYLYDGQTLAAGHNPYVHAPLKEIETLDASGALNDAHWLTWINNPELVTIYQPTSQWVFAGIVKTTDLVLGGAVGADQYGHAFRLVFSLLDLLIVVMLLAQLHHLGRSAWWAVMYAWSPLVICETAWSGHQDGIGIAAILASLLLAQRAARSEEGRRVLWWAAAAGVMLGLAAGVKPFVLALALPMAWKLKGEAGGWSRIGVAAGACVVALVGLYLPFVLMDGGMGGMLETSRQFVSRWRFNGSLHPLIEAAVRPTLDGEPWDIAARAKLIADAVAAGVLLVVLVGAMLFHRVPWRAATTFFFAMVCLSSTVHPWYLLWALALLPVSWSAARTFVGPAVWVASLTLPWSYAAWLNVAVGGDTSGGGGGGGGYEIGLGLTLAIWLPIYAAVGWGTADVLRGMRADRRGEVRRVRGGRG